MNVTSFIHQQIECKIECTKVYDLFYDICVKVDPSKQDKWHKWHVGGYVFKSVESFVNDTHLWKYLDIVSVYHTYCREAMKVTHQDPSLAYCACFCILFFTVVFKLYLDNIEPSS